MGRTLAAEGALIGVLDRDEAALARLSDTLDGAQGVACDVTDPEQVEQKFDLLAGQMGKIHALINNAGLLFSAPLLSVGTGGLLAHPVDAWQKTRAVNLDAVFYTTRVAAQHMVRSRTRGVIVNISSVAASGNAGQSAYSAAKAGVEALVVTWAKELGPWGIRVAGVAPGYTDAPSTSAAVPESQLQQIASETAVRRLGKPCEIGAAVRFVLENDFVTGTTIRVDGGLRV
ncbi:MAG: SDR family oxidoreductase [Alphaproteobacteria bacterium]|nr:SDR family oxidoreductase [Alphaproteobacteria bacterium]